MKLYMIQIGNMVWMMNSLYCSKIKLGILFLLRKVVTLLITNESIKLKGNKMGVCIDTKLDLLLRVSNKNMRLIMKIFLALWLSQSP
jgi:hypothetical protein